jgi:hypothetical protein
MIATGPRLVLLVIACALFAVAALWTPPAPPRFSLTAAGLFFFAAAWLFAG